MTSEHRGVLVVGAGPAGCAAAILLRQRGHDVLLVDRARFPRDKICGEGVSPEAWRLLDLLDAGDAVRALAPYRLRGMMIVSPSGLTCRGSYRRADGRDGFAVPRVAFDHALLQRARAAGVDVREGCHASAVHTAEGVVRGLTLVDATGARRVDARLIVAADGRRSIVARHLGLLYPHARLRKFAVRGYWQGIQELGPWGEMHGCFAGGYCGVAPLATELANVTLVLDRRHLASAAGALEFFYRRTLATRWPGLAERLRNARLLGPPAAIGPLAVVARRVSAPGVLLVGDAAGFYDPFTGEGVTLALRSAELAASVADRALRSDTADDLSAYDRARWSAIRDKFRFNQTLQWAVAWPALGDAVVRRLARRPELADRLVGIAGDFVPARAAFGPRFIWDLLTA